MGTERLCHLELSGQQVVIIKREIWSNIFDLLVLVMVDCPVPFSIVKTPAMDP